MLKRLCALLVLLALVVSFTGCTYIWGSDRGHPASMYIVENKPDMSVTGRHIATHFEIFFDGLNNMHQFWDRHFMNYDWDDPYYN